MGCFNSCRPGGGQGERRRDLTNRGMPREERPITIPASHSSVTKKAHFNIEQVENERVQHRMCAAELFHPDTDTSSGPEELK